MVKEGYQVLKSPESLISPRMFLTHRIERAIVRATELHDGQARKIRKVPYIVHPYAVAFLLAHYESDEDVIIAGLLHDTLEDVPGYTYDMLREEFGERVAAIVREVTEDYTEDEKLDQTRRSAGWRVRKETYLANLANDSRGALLVAAADKIHNMRSFLDDRKMVGEDVWKHLLTKPESMKWFYGEVTKTIVARLDHPLAEELQKAYAELEKAL
jgi:(p)ppGpp synthase/HD superfamily hydrolase